MFLSTPRISTLTLLAGLVVGGVLAPLTAGAEDGKTLRVTGLAQVDYRTAFQAPPGVASHEFNLRRARVNFDAGVTSRIRCELQLQGDGANVGSASLIDAYVDFLVHPGLTLRAGQNKYEFDFEAREGDPAIPLLDRSFASNAVAGSLSGLSTANIAVAAARDRGLTLVSDFERAGMKWRVGGGVYQGSGRSSDDDSAVAFTLRAEAARGPVKLGMGYLRSPPAARADPLPTRFEGVNVGAIFERGRMLLRGEYYGARRDRAGRREDVAGFYLVGGVSVVTSLDVLVRYQRLRDGHFPAGEDGIRSVDLGVKWFFERRGRCAGTFLAANLMFRRADPGFDQGVTLLDDGRGELLASGRDVGTVLIVRWQVEF